MGDVLTKLSQIREIKDEKDQLFRSIFCDQLEHYAKENLLQLDDADVLVDVFHQMKSNMSQEEKDSFFLQLLDGFKIHVDSKRVELKDIVIRHLERMHLIR